MKHALALTAVSVLAVGTLAACGSETDGDAADGGTLSVVASTNVWGDVAASVGGDLVEVTSIISDGNQDPHGFEADADTLLTVADADVVVANGGGYDDFVATMVTSSKTDADVVDAFELSGHGEEAEDDTASDEGDHAEEEHADEDEHGHSHGEVNEHVWYDVPTVGKVAEAIAASLAEADPDNAGTYEANAAALQAELDGLTAAEEELHTSVEGTRVGVTEPLPVYLAQALGLDDVTPEAFSEAVEEGEDVPVAVVQDVLDQIDGGELGLLFYNDQTTSPVTEQVRSAAEAAGVPVVPVTELLPEGDDYVSWMQGNIDAVAAALAAA